MNSLLVNAQIFFLCRNVYSGSFYHFHRQMISNSIQFDRYGLKSFELWESWSDAHWGNTNLKKETNFSNKILGQRGR